jgi:hypothetical protein
VHWRGKKKVEMGKKARRRMSGRFEQNTKPSNVKTVFSASYPVTEATP